MKRLLQLLQPKSLHPGTFFSSLLIVFAFPPWDFMPLIWVALVPWFFAIKDSRSYRSALIQGVWLSFLMSVMGFYWVAYALHEFGGVPWLLSVLGLLLFSIPGQPQFIVMAPLILWVRRSFPASRWSSWQGAVLILTLSLVYAGVDWLLPKLFMDTLGHALYSARHIRQIADIGGAPLITVLVLCFNFALFLAIDHFRHRGEPSIRPAIRAAGPALLLAAVLCAGSWGYGSWRLDTVRKAVTTPQGFLQAGVIQGNIGDVEKLAAEQGLRDAADQVVNTMLELSDHALNLSPRPDILIWPETSYPSTFRTPMTADELGRDLRLERFVAERGVPLLFGAYDTQGRKDFNSFFVLTPSPVAPSTIKTSGAGAIRGDENHVQIYHKSILLLFGEFIPGSERIKWIREQFPQVGNFGRGPGPSVLSVRPSRLEGSSGSRPEVFTSPVICYEALFPNYVIEAARKGSQLILNITNDSWFGRWGEPQLHLALITFRSVESRLPQLRSTNTGISALITPDGDIVQRTAWGVPLVMNSRIPIIEPIPTLMKKWGDWFGWFAFCSGWVLLLALSPWIQNFRRVTSPSTGGPAAPSSR